MRSYMRANLKPQGSAPSAFDSLIASAQNYWDCQEASGNLVDGPGTADLAPTGTPDYQGAGPTAWLPYGVHTSTGVFFSAASPAGRVAIPFSIAAWVKVWPTAPAGFENIISRRNDTIYEFEFRLSSGNPSLLTTNGSVNASLGAIADTNWHFVGVACDGSNVSFYKDGTFQTISSSRSITNQTVALGLGANAAGTAHTLAGYLAGVGIWDSELSEADFDVLFAGP